jgi:sigma-B regulation protein RsbU (phosphoserine phosphatase)
MLRLLGAIAAQLGVAIQQKHGEQELRANEEEFHAAREIQERLFPKKAPVFPGFDIAGRSEAASAAGGDYFDFLPVAGGRLGLAVGDVTGHGIGPALLMAEARAYLRVLAQSQGELSDVLTTMNRVLAEDIGSERFMTLMLVTLEPDGRQLSFANAGHPSGYILDAAGGVKHMLRRTGVPLGMRFDTAYPATPPVSLERGDTVVLLTDGIEEALGPGDAMFGIDRALEVIRAQRGQPADLQVSRLFEAVQQFAQNEPQMDDATVVVIRVL